MQNQTVNIEEQIPLGVEQGAMKASRLSGVRSDALILWAAGATRLLARISLGLLIILAPLRYSSVLISRTITPVYPGYTNLLIYPSDLFLLLTLVFWGASLAFQARRISLRPMGLTLFLACLTIIAWLSAAFSADRLISLNQSVRLTLLFGLYLFVLNEIRSLIWIYVPVGLQVLTQSLVGILQVLNQHSLGLTWLNELVLDPSIKGVSIVWTAATRSLRAYGLTDHPNLLGGGLALGLIFLAAWYLETHATLRFLVGSLFTLGAIGLLLTFSRSAYLGLAVGLILLAAWLWFSKRKAGVVSLIALAIGTLVLLSPFLWQNRMNLATRFNYDNSFSAATPENQALNERTLLAKLALAQFAAHPLTGTGIAAFPLALYQANPKYPFNFQPPHFVLLDVAAETGIFGAFFYLAVDLFPWVYLFIRRKQVHFSLALAGTAAALLAITVISFFDYYPWMLNPGQLWQWLVWGLWGGLIATSIRKDTVHG